MINNRKNIPIVHIKLFEIIESNSCTSPKKTFSQRLQKRLSMPKYLSKTGRLYESTYQPDSPYFESGSKTRYKSSKQRNLEELISIRRCHLFYS
jgi:hypothetical protein